MTLVERDQPSADKAAAGIGRMLEGAVKRGKLAADPNLPLGEIEEDGRQRWFSLEEVNELRRRIRVGKKSLMPPRPAGKAPCFRP